jgi:UDP-N-acetylmuramyl tripeptide synthase
LAAAGLEGLEVPHSLRALGELAAGWRQQFAMPLLAVTGSNGKTTVTQMIASILRAWHPGPDQALATQGNFNNDIGLPLTLLRLATVDLQSASDPSQMQVTSSPSFVHAHFATTCSAAALRPRRLPTR